MEKHKPSAALGRKVKMLVVAGVNHGSIAKIIGVSKPTLYKYYQKELDDALDETLGDVTATLVQKALNGDTASMIFFLKVRGKKYGWSERHEITGADGGAIQTEEVGAKAALAQHIARIANPEGEDGGDSSSD